MRYEGDYSPEIYKELLQEREAFKQQSWETLSPGDKLSKFEQLLSYGDLLAVLGDQRTERVGETPYNNYHASTTEDDNLIFFGSTTSNRFSGRNRHLLREEADLLLAKLHELQSVTTLSELERYKNFNEFIKTRFEYLSNKYVEVLPIEHPENIHVAFLPSGTEAELIGVMAAIGMSPEGKVINTYFPYAGTSTGPEAKGTFGNSKNWQGEVRKTGEKIQGLEIAAWHEIGTDYVEDVKTSVENIFIKYSTQTPKPTLILHYIPGNKLGQEIGDLGYYAALAKAYKMPVLVNIDDAQGRINENRMQDLIEGDGDERHVQSYVNYMKRNGPNRNQSTELLIQEAEEEIKKLPHIFAFSVSKSYGVVPFAGVVYYDDKIKQSLETFFSKAGGLNKDISFYANSQMLPGLKGVERSDVDEVPNLPLMLKLSAGIRNMEEFQSIKYAERRLVFGSLSFAARSKIENIRGFRLHTQTNPSANTDFESQDLDTVVTFSVEGAGGPLDKKDLDFIHKMLAHGEVPAPNIPTTQVQENYYRKALQLGAPVEDKNGFAYMRLSFSSVDAIEVHDRAEQLQKEGVGPSQAITEAISEKMTDVAVALNMVQNAVKIYEKMKAEEQKKPSLENSKVT